MRLQREDRAEGQELGSHPGAGTSWPCDLGQLPASLDLSFPFWVMGRFGLQELSSPLQPCKLPEY